MKLQISWMIKEFKTSKLSSKTEQSSFTWLNRFLIKHASVLKPGVKLSPKFVKAKISKIKPGIKIWQSTKWHLSKTSDWSNLRLELMNQSRLRGTRSELNLLMKELISYCPPKISFSSKYFKETQMSQQGEMQLRRENCSDL